MGGSVGTGTDGRVVRSRCAPFFAGSFLEVSDLGGDRPPHGLMPCLESRCFLYTTQIRAHFLKSHTGSDPNAPIKTDAQWACMADDEDR